MHETEIESGLAEPITPNQKRALMWACRWHADFEYGLMGTTEARVLDFVNDRFNMQLADLDDMTKSEASYILNQLDTRKR